MSLSKPSCCHLKEVPIPQVGVLIPKSMHVFSSNSFGEFNEFWFLTLFSFHIDLGAKVSEVCGVSGFLPADGAFALKYFLPHVEIPESQWNTHFL